MINKIKGALYSLLGLVWLYFFPSSFFSIGRAKAGEIPPLDWEATVVERQENYYFDSKRSLSYQSPQRVQASLTKITIVTSEETSQKDPNDLSVASTSFTVSSFESNAPKTKIRARKNLTQAQTFQNQTYQVLVKAEKPVFPSVVLDSKTSVIEFFEKLSLKDFSNLFFSIKIFQPIVLVFPSPFDKSILAHFLEKVPDLLDLDLTLQNIENPKFKIEAGHFDFFVYLQGVKTFLEQMTKVGQGIIGNNRPRILPHTTRIQRSNRTYGPIPDSIRLEWRRHTNRPEFYRRLIAKPTLEKLPKQIAEGAGLYFQGEILQNGLVVGYIGKSVSSLGVRTGVELRAIEKDLSDLFRFWFRHRAFFNTESGKQILNGLKDRFLRRLAQNTLRPTRCHSVRWFMAQISRFPEQFESGQGNFLSYPVIFRKQLDIPNSTIDPILQDVVLRAYETFAIREFITHQTIFRRRLPYLTNGLVSEGALVLLLNERQMSPCRPIPICLLEEFICLSRDEVSNLVINYGWTWEKTAILYDPNLGIESIEDFKRELLRLRLPELLNQV